MRRNDKVESPLARREGLVVQELPDEVLVYDFRTANAHCLNRTAAEVWKRCDGKATVSEISRSLRQEMGEAAPPELVWMALERLEKASLLERSVRPPDPGAISRRAALRRLGVAAAAVPLVTSILAPTANAAATCIPESQCGPGKCDVPCHTTGSTDCTKVCRPRGNKSENCDTSNWQCVGNPAEGCPAAPDGSPC